MTMHVIVKNYGHPAKVTTVENGETTVDVLGPECQDMDYVIYKGKAITVEEIDPSSVSDVQDSGVEDTASETAINETSDVIDDPAMNGSIDGNTVVTERDPSADA